MIHMHLKPAALIGIFVLAAGMGSSAILFNYGDITGDVNVSGPTFYAADNEKLIFNSPPDENQSFHSKVGPSYADLKFFASRDLGGKSWYPVRVNMYANVKTVDEEKNNASLNLEFNYKNSNGNRDGCSEWINVQSKGEYHTVSTSCSFNVTGGVENFEYVISSNEDEFDLKAEGDTRVEVKDQ